MPAVIFCDSAEPKCAPPARRPIEAQATSQQLLHVCVARASSVVVDRLEDHRAQISCSKLTGRRVGNEHAFLFVTTVAEAAPSPR